MEIHQKKAGPDYHRLKTMVQRSIEQNLRIKNFEGRNGNFDTSAVVKSQGTKQREQRSLGDCWQWKAKGQCSKGDNCSFCNDINKRGKVTPSNPSPNSLMQQNERKSSRTRSPRGKSPSGRMFRLPCKDYLRGTCTNSFCEDRHPPECLFYKSECALMRIARLKNSLAKVLKRIVTKVQWLCLKKYKTIELRISRYGAAEVFIDFAEDLKHTETNPMCNIHRSRCTSRLHSRPKSFAWNDLPR